MLVAALGAEVTAISHCPRNKDGARKMGASNIIATGQKGWAVPASRRLISTFPVEMPLAEYLELLDVSSTVVYMGILEAGPPELPPGLMIRNNSAIRTGSKKEISEMLELVKSKVITSWIGEFLASQVTEVLQRHANIGSF
jgi:D-arabinose 1-dehydrogenase-like Zn-dependent alcohol dehydrogenase